MFERTLSTLAVAAIAAIGLTAEVGAQARGPAVLLTIDDAIGPATSDYYRRGLEGAAARGATVVVLRLNTPGGLDSAMRDIIQATLASPVPVITWVGPNGARAASAGTYMLYASHVAAMAPATNLGAATPVSIGGGPPGGGKDDADGDAPAEGADDADTESEKSSPTDASGRKAINDAVAYIRGLAELRGRNAEWAERAVREAASLPASEALAMEVIDLIAEDVTAVLAAAHGREVKTAGGTVTLDTEGLPVEAVEPDWRNKLLAVITNPNVAYLLLIIGLYGLLLEGYNPGAVVPGVVGAICLLLAAYALQLLPVNYAGLALVLLGIALIVAETFVPSFGALGLGGIAALVFGSIMLLDTDVPGFGVSRSLIGSIALFAGALTLATLTLVLKSRRQPVATGAEELVGMVGIADDDFDSTGHVRVHGERWNARTDSPLRAGQRARIISMDGLTLTVRPETD